VDTSIINLLGGTYILTDIQSDVSVAVNNVRLNQYKVNFERIRGVEYQTSEGKKIETGYEMVGHGDGFQFKISLMDAYKESMGLVSVMVGNDVVEPDEDGIYLIKSVKEEKSVTVIGIKEDDRVLTANMINSLADKVSSAADVDAIIEATRMYESLSEEEKALVTNYEHLKNLQSQASEYNHTANDVTVSGIDWNLKVVSVKLSSNTDACARIYDKLSSEYILSLYDVYLLNVMTGKKHELSEGEKVIVTIPTPNFTYFNDPLVIHERSSDGKLEYIILNVNGDTSSFELESFSSMGVVAKRRLGTGSSSLFNNIGNGINNIKDMLASMFEIPDTTGNNSSESWEDSVQSEGGKEGVLDGSKDMENGSGTNSNGASGNGGFVQGSRSSANGSAVILILILLMGVFLATAAVIAVKKASFKRSSDNKDVKNSKKL
jgi:hypothetical protein